MSPLRPPRAVLAFAPVGLALGAIPWLGLPDFYITFLYLCFHWVTLATSWNLLSGYSGYFSFGHGAFFEPGVYTAANLLARLQVSFLWAVPAAGLVAALLSLGIGLVVFRLRRLQGELFALLTLAVPFMFDTIVGKLPGLGAPPSPGERGAGVPDLPPPARAAAAARRHAERGRAADAGPPPRADGPPAAPAAGRAVLGPAPMVVDTIFEVMAEIHRAGVALLLVEQHVTNALGLAARGYVLEDGRIALAGSRAELRQHPLITSAYLGVTPVAARRGGPLVSFATKPGQTPAPRPALRGEGPLIELSSAHAKQEERDMDLVLKGRVALVTGGSMGIGKAIALALAKAGTRIAICARTKEPLVDAAAEVAKEATTEVIGFQGDISQQAEAEKIVTQARERFGQIHIVVNNAGGRRMGPVADRKDEDWLELVNQKLLGAIRVTRAALPAMPKSAEGRIINVTGLTAQQVIPNLAVVSATNAAVTALTKNLSAELAKDRILVNAVSPGLVRTEFWERRAQEMATAQNITPQQWMDQFAASMGIPLGRWATPNDIANAVLFLASDLASYITGVTLVVDGGMRKGIA